MIKVATPADVDRLVQLGALMHAESVFRYISYAPEKVRSALSALIGGDGVVFVAERGGVIVGGLAVAVTEYWFSHERVGVDRAFFIEPAHRHGITALRLISAMEAWCKSMGARESHLAITAGVNVDGVSKLCELAGYRNAGPIFKKEL